MIRGSMLMDTRHTTHVIQDPHTNGTGSMVVVSGRGEDGRGIVGRNDSKGIRTAVLFK